MASLKQDLAKAVNILAKDSKLTGLLQITTPLERSQNIVPMRRPPSGASAKPRLSLYLKFGKNLGYNVTTNQLVVDIYVPLPLQRDTGVAFDIANRVKELLDKKPIGRGLRWLSTDPDRPSTTGWHKATVVFTLQTTQS